VNNINNNFTGIKNGIAIGQILFLIIVVLLFFVEPLRLAVAGFIPGGFSVVSVLFFLQIVIMILAMLFSKKRFISNAALVLLSLLFCLFATEFAFRKFHQFGGNKLEFRNNVNPFVSFDNELFKTYRPNSDFYFINDKADGGDSILVQINEDGYRGRLMDTVKRENEFRTILIGDSFLQSIQVEYGNTLGSHLNQMGQDSLSFLQHGYPSYSPLLEFNWVLKKAIKYKPNRVILFLYPNDFYSGNNVGDLGYKPYTVFDENGIPTHFDFSEVKRAQSKKIHEIIYNDLLKFRCIGFFIFKHRLYNSQKQFDPYSIDDLLNMSKEAFSNLYNLNVQSDLLLSSYWDFVSLMRDHKALDLKTKQRIDYTLSILERMNNTLSQKSIELAVVYIPSYDQIPSPKNKYNGMSPFQHMVFPEAGLQFEIDSFCNSKNIPYLDLYDKFSTIVDNNPNIQLYLPNNGHFTKDGHNIVANEVYNHFY
jgi:hypothetical protein